MTQPQDIVDLTMAMADFAKKQKKQLPDAQQAMIDAILLAEEIQRHAAPNNQLAARLRGASMRYRPSGCFTICAYMDSLADRLDGKLKSIN